MCITKQQAQNKNICCTDRNTIKIFFFYSFYFSSQSTRNKISKDQLFKKLSALDLKETSLICLSALRRSQSEIWRSEFPLLTR